MTVTAIIPARFASSRLPGKPLADILGKPMIRRVYEQVVQARSVDRVLVATDDERVREAVDSFGGEVRMTREDHVSGTDRLAEVAADLDCDLVVNVQGDEPLIDPAVIDKAVAPLVCDPLVKMGTLVAPLNSREEFLNPNVVKAVVDAKGDALYFSRAPIPWPRDAADNLSNDLQEVRALRHIGLYVYRREFLLRFAAMEESLLEKTERLEQLRVVEAGVKIRTVLTEHGAIGVDTPEDLERVREILQA